jgi:hypothetical protein
MRGRRADMNKDSVSWKQGYDQGFSDALCGESNAFSFAVTEGERDWMDGYYEGGVAGESALLDEHGDRLDSYGD